MFKMDYCLGIIKCFYFLLLVSHSAKTILRNMDWKVGKLLNFKFLSGVYISPCLQILYFVQSPRLKKIGKIQLGSYLLLGLIYGLSFRIQAASYFLQSWVKKPV